MSRQVVAGIDIGGTNTAIGLVDVTGQCVAADRMRTTDFDSPADFVVAALRALDRMRSETPLAGIGVGAPNGNFYRGSIEFAPNLRWKGVIPLAEMFREHVAVPVLLTNDANAAAIGEGMFGATRGMRDYIVITLGTGVGSGIVVNGELLYGHDGFAGEIGHTIYDPAGRDCGCGRRGCLETYASAGGLKRTVLELLATRNAESVFRALPPTEISSLRIAEAAASGDTIACEAFEFTGRVLGLKLADAIAHTSPEAIVLFGGLAQAGDLIFEPTRRWMEEYTLNIYQGKVRLLASGLAQENVAVLGAAALVWQQLNRNAQ
ncbi:ROK family protein [candidate division KSB1 bacterium]|nr:ROK family protein [candidate division KSB1 bacterium]